MNVTTPLKPWEKEVAITFHRPPPKSTLNKALLGIVAGGALFSILSWQKTSPKLSTRVLQAALIPATFFGFYKAWEIRGWTKNEKVDLLKKKNLNLWELKAWGDKLTPEERALLIRKDFFGDISYTNFLQCHGIEEVERLFSGGRNLKYRECLEKKFLDAVGRAQSKDELRTIPSLPILEVSSGEYLAHIPGIITFKLEEQEWKWSGNYPNYNLMKALVDYKVALKTHRGFYVAEAIAGWIDKINKPSPRSRAARLCWEYMLDGEAEIQVHFQRETWNKLPQHPEILPFVEKLPWFKKTLLGENFLSKWVAEQHAWSKNAIVYVIQNYHLNPNEDSLLANALKKRDRPLSEALIQCGATVSEEIFQGVIDRNDPEYLEVLIASPLLDINKKINNSKIPPIVQAIIWKKRACAQLLWNQPKLDRSILWYKRDLKQLANFYYLSLEDPANT